MKKKLLLLVSLISLQIHAQTISNIYSVPANPTTADFVNVLVDCQFNSGTCDTHTQGQYFQTANDIGAWALHCLGVLTVICTHTDTFPLGMLPAGNYTFTFQLDEGFGFPTCTPGFVPGPSANYNFTVSLPTSEQEIEKEAFNIYPNPVERELRIRNTELRIETIKLYNILGEEISGQKPTVDSQKEIVIDVSGFSPGMYVVEMKAGENLSRKIFSVQR